MDACYKNYDINDYVVHLMIKRHVGLIYGTSDYLQVVRKEVNSWLGKNG